MLTSPAIENFFLSISTYDLTKERDFDRFHIAFPDMLMIKVYAPYNMTAEKLEERRKDEVRNKTQSKREKKAEEKVQKSSQLSSQSLGKSSL